MELMTSWEEKGLHRGLRQGLEQGLEQGRRQEAAALILRLLRRRIGRLPRGLEDRLSHLSIAALEDLGEAILGFEHAEQLEAWLSQHGERAV